MIKKDEELIKDYLKGNERAFEILIKRYLKPIFNFVFSLTQDKEITEDLVQEIFVKTWKNLKKYNPQYSFKTWIFTIAKNTIIDWQREKKEIPFSFLEEKNGFFSQNLLDKNPLPDEIFFQKEIKNFLEKISLKYREILELYFYEGLNLREISQSLKISLNTVKSRYRRAIRILKDYFQRRE